MSETTLPVLDLDKVIKAFVERRRKRRIRVGIPIVVKGLDFQGNRFEETSQSVNFSASGTCFYLKRRIRVGSTVQLLISLPPDLETYETMAQVKRVEDGKQPQGYRFAVKFMRVRAKPRTEDESLESTPLCLLSA